MSVVDTATGEIVEFDRPAAERRAERIRLRLDAIADNYATVMPMIREAIEQRDDMALGYRSPGEYVADRFGGALQRLGVEVRRAVVGELTAAGLSTRAIAPVVGTSHETVRSDLNVGVKDLTPAPAPATPVFPRPVTGLDGKTYNRPEPKADPLAEAVAEFPDLAFFSDDPQRVVLMAEDLRRYRERGELDMRLDNLRRSVAVEQSKRDGTYVAPVLPKVCFACGQAVREKS